MVNVPLVTTHQAAISGMLEAILVCQKDIKFASVAGVPGKEKSFTITTGASIPGELQRAVVDAALADFVVGNGIDYKVTTLRGSFKGELK